MANWSNPTLTSNYTNFVTEVKDRDTDCATFFDGSTSTNLPTGTKRWNATSSKFEKWSGSAWSDLAATYSISVSGTAGNITGVAAAANGGTGQSSFTVGDLLYASGATSLAKLADVATGSALISGGVGVAPFWGKIGLTTHVSGTLPVANGGTGATTSTGSGAVVLANSPTFVTSAWSPLLIGGTQTTSTLILRSTSGVGTTGADIIFQTGNNGATEAMRVLNNGNVGVGTATPKDVIDANGRVRSYRTATNDGVFAFGSDTTPANFFYGTGGTTGYLAAWTNSLERFRVDAAGNFLVGKTAYDVGSVGVELRPGGLFCVTANLSSTNELVNFNNINTGNVAYDIAFRQQTVSVGNIRVNSNSVSYNTSSDYRLKTEIAPMQGGLSKVLALKPVTFAWKSDGTLGEGFIAHELQAVVPGAVTGEKDGVDESGAPKYQSIDPSFLIATLVAAIQELKQEVDALKNAQLSANPG